MSAEVGYRVAGGVQAGLLGVGLLVSDAPPLLCALAFALPALQAYRSLRGRPIAVTAPIIAMGGLATLVALAALRARGADGWIVLSLLFAALSSAIAIAPFARSLALLALLSRQVAFIVVQMVPGAAAVQAQVLLAALPLLALEWTWISMAASQRLARRPRIIERRLGALQPTSARRGFLLVAVVVVALFVSASWTIYLALPRAYPNTEDEGTTPIEDDPHGPEAEHYAPMRFPDAIAMRGSLASGVPSFVASVRLRREGEILRLPSNALYWKLMTYATYDKGRWTAEGQSVAKADEDDGTRDGRVTLARDSDSGEFVQQAVRVAPLMPQLLLALDPVQAIALPRVWILEGGGLVGEAPPPDAQGESATLGFTAWSAAAPNVPRAHERAMNTDGRYVERPASSARIARVALDIAGHLGSDRERVDMLAAYLRNRYEYRRDFEPSPANEDPIDYFLFVRCTGHCELFAGALALMLRSLGIPARLVGGFQGGQWEELGAYYLVRSNDAHAWVEVCYEHAGWTRVDPTPVSTTPEAAEVQADPSTAAVAPVPADRDEDVGADTRVHWSARILRLDARDRARLLTGIPKGWVAGLAALAALALGIARVVAGLGTWRAAAALPDGLEDAQTRALAPFLAEALRLVALAGHARGPSETLVELETRVAEADREAGAALARVGGMYRSWRYGGALPPAADAIADALLDLRGAVTRSPR